MLFDQGKARLEEPAFIGQHRRGSQDWTRKRKLEFKHLAFHILRNHKVSAAVGLLKLFKDLDDMEHLPTTTALRKARQKFRHTAFRALNTEAVALFEQLWAEDGALKLWQGYRVLGVDGTYLNLESTPELAEHFGEPKKGKYVLALASVLVDLLNEVILEATVDSCYRSERDLLFSALAPALRPGAVVVLDRLYADYAVLAFLRAQGCHFVVRVPKSGFKEARRLRASSTEWEATETLQVTRTQKQRVEEAGWPEEIAVRYVKVRHSGQDEILVTSLPAEIPREALWELYGKRWGVETYFDRLKNVLDLERWSGHSVEMVLQDFYGLVYLGTLEAAVAAEAEAALEATKYTVNRTLSTATVLEYLFALLLDPSQTGDTILEKMEPVLLTNPIFRAKPDRQFPRKRKSSTMLNRHFRYRKRIIS